MSISSTTAEKLATMNVNLEISAESKYSASAVEKLVEIVTDNNLHIKIHAGTRSADSLMKFAKLGGSNITIVL